MESRLYGGFTSDEIANLNKEKEPIAKAWARDRSKYGHEWNKSHPEKFKDSLKKYEESEKGKIARARVVKNRLELLRSLYTPKTFSIILKFYDECPEGYHVDHIIPISKGGNHSLENLQYLLAQANKKKAAKIVTDLTLPPHCPINRNYYQS